MLRVTIKNFQSIRHETLEVSGFTVLTGRSNIGKSAVIRSVLYLLRNEPGTDFVRHDPSTCNRIIKGGKTCKCFSSVTLELNGHTVTWEKGDTVNRYIVDGETYDKAERGPPPFLEALNLSPVKMGDEGVMVQIADQWNPLFLFGRPASEVASALGDVRDLPKVQEAIKAAEKDRKEAASTLKVRKQDLQKANDDLASFTDVVPLEATVERLKGLKDRWLAASERVNKLRSWLDRVTDLTSSLVTLETPVAVPVFDPVEDRGRHHGVLAGWIACKERLDLGISDLDRALAVPVSDSLPDTSRVENLFRWQATHTTLSRVLASFEGDPPSFTVPDSSRWECLSSFRTTLNPLVERFKELKKELEDLDRQDRELQAEIALYPTCPTCGGVVSCEEDPS